MMGEAELDVLPRWVVAPELDAGSIDPLGDQAESDRLADQILPGLTVQTRRARYLSFLAWAHLRLEREAQATDRWEVALAVGERRRQLAGRHVCRFLGRDKAAALELKDGEPLPKRLHQQTARIQYAGLYQSCGLVDAKEEATELAEELAGLFAKRVPARLPGTAKACDRMPCLSFEGESARREKAGLARALLEESTDAEQRRKTLQAVTLTMLKRTPAAMLARFLDPRWRRRAGAGRLLHEAACHELVAYPLKLMFLALYRSQGAFRAAVPPRPRFAPFEIDPREPSALMAGIVAHLRRAERLGLVTPKVGVRTLKEHVLEKHLAAKGDGAWVSQDWRLVRPGLANALPAAANFRLAAFASLLRDCE